MTKEIWAAVIIGIAQIIFSGLIAGKQIKVARELAKPETNHKKPRENLLRKIVLFSEKFKLHITLPLFFNIALMCHGIYKYGFNLAIVSAFSSLVIILLVFQIFMEILLSTISHILRRLKCHESILFELTDKPCKESGGKCIF